MNNVIKNLNNENKTTLKYLTNPIYQNNVNNISNVKENKIKYKSSEVKFYRKRIINLTKLMFKNEFPSIYLKVQFA